MRPFSRQAIELEEPPGKIIVGLVTVISLVMDLAERVVDSTRDRP